MINEYRVYILDANAIRILSYEQILAKKQEDNTIVSTIADIKYEISNLEKTNLLTIEQMSDLSYTKMYEIMNSQKSVRDIINYYNNKGTGDVALLSYALSVNEGKLCKDKIIIVTNDHGLKVACDELGVDWISVDKF